jgi:short-subunit dehydrogenase
MYGSRVALQGMLKQGRGQIYNMEGQGSDGTMRPGLTLYGTTKAAITALTKGLIKEVKGKPVQVCYLSPGMVITDLLVGDYSPEEFERVKRIFNILADKLETVSPWLVDQILANDKHGARIAWLTPQKAAYRFLTARFNKRDLFS